MTDQELPETCPCCGADNADPVTGDWRYPRLAPYCSHACAETGAAWDREWAESESQMVADLAEADKLASEWRASRARCDETAHYRSEG